MDEGYVRECSRAVSVELREDGREGRREER